MDQIEIGVSTLRIEGNPAKLYEELAMAAQEFVPIPKVAKGQSGNRHFDYANYATIMRCVRPALSKHGIVVMQPLHSNDDEAVTTTILAGHGAAIVSSFSFVPHKDPQEFGKHHTYYRRYQLQAMLGLEGDKDADDLPDVNEQGFTEKQEASSPKAKASVEKPPAAAKEQKTNGSAKPSAASTESSEPKPEPKPEEKKPEKTVINPAKAIDGIEDAKLNTVLSAIMKQMDPPWKLMDVRSFYAEHFDAKPEDMPHPDQMKAPLKRQILSKLIEVKGVAPF